MKKKLVGKLITAAMALTMAAGAFSPVTAMAAEEEDGFVFEAEYTDLSFVFGHGYSNEVEGTGCIAEDTFDADASNGYFVGYLYEEGNELEFYINSDKDVEDATLILRATMEFQDATITWQDFSITVNDEDPIQYRDMKFKKVEDVFSLSGKLRPFSDFTIGNINLKEGENVIKLTVNNSTTMTGTMRATAPIVDCIKIQTDSDAQLTWNEDEGFPMEDNIG